MKQVTREQFEELMKNARANSDECACPVWNIKGARASQYNIDRSDRGRCYWSPRAGGFFILLSPAGKELTDMETRKRVSSWIWERNAAVEELGEGDETELPELTSRVIREIASRQPLTTEQRMDRALQAIGRPPRCLAGPRRMMAGPKADQNEQMLFQAATECGMDAVELNWLLRELEAAGLTRNIGNNHQSNNTLTLKGLDRLETGGAAFVSKTAFVAMWFDDEVSDAYEQGIKPAVRKAGYEPMRIDRKEHSNRIDDEIIAEIRRARFLVCDFTCGLLPGHDAGTRKTAIARGSVYYEAGFAHGLGKKVIWTCRSDLIEHVHFDLRQYNTILWEDGKENELRQALLNRIRAEIV